MNELHLINVKWDNKYTHVVDFQNVAQRRGFLLQEDHFTADDNVRLLTSDTIDIVVKLDYLYVIQHYNYVYFVEYKNTPAERERFYFITKTEFESTNHETRLYLQLDVWQTYMFITKNSSVTYKPVFSILNSFINRQHEDRWTRPNPSTPTLYPKRSLTKENLEVGEMLMKSETTATYKIANYSYDIYLLITTRMVDVGSVGERGTILQKTQTYMSSYLIFDPIGHTKKVKILLGSVKYTTPTFSEINLNDLTDEYGNPIDIKINNEKLLKISKINYLPFQISGIVDTDGNILIEATEYYYSFVPVSYRVTASTVTYNIILVNQFDVQDPFDQYILFNIGQYTQNITSYLYNNDASYDYEPKLLNSEFNYKMISSSKSDNIIIQEEYINGSVDVLYRSSLDIWGYEEIGLSNYKGDTLGVVQNMRTKNNNEVTLLTDPYLQYIIANRNQIQTQQTLNAIGGLGSLGTVGVGVGMLSTGHLALGLGMLMGGLRGMQNNADTVLSEVAKQNDYKNKADDIRTKQNTLIVDKFIQSDKYRLYEMGMTTEYKDRVFKYLTQYGYLVNKLGVPNLTTRYYYNFVKCSQIELDPYIVTEADVRKQIEEIYLKGVTIWHFRNVDTFRFIDYTKENVEMTLVP